MTKLTVAFRNFANAPKKIQFYELCTHNQGSEVSFNLSSYTLCVMTFYKCGLPQDKL